ncbi:hypothetical protein [Streptomyces sp. GESEQ-35]|uniref:hypothetical protein n=1 Tax=Streptomyces sp. GESEQ-35 TaxID=2812657 RepID=UPI001B3418DC|nr:hypothetical protein [Streptomyces sp. GESEQ-35]
MSRTGGGRSRWFGRRGDRSAAAESAPTSQAEGFANTGEGGERLLVEEYDGIRLLRTPSDDALGTSDVADLARVLSADADTVTVLTGADASHSADLWPRLGGVLDELRDDGIRTVRLVMTAAGDDRLEAPALARRIADAWQLEVVAPDGLALVVPGGGLFVPARGPYAGGGPVGEEGSWWRFLPDGAEPERIGPRQPAPDWQPAIELLPEKVGAASVIQQIPAGVLARSRDVDPPGLGDLCYAVPADPRGPTVLLGVPEGGDVSAGDVVELLTALPEPTRNLVRIAPGGHRDVLPTVQAVSDTLGAEVTACTGMPLLTHGSAARSGVHAVVLGADGSPRWQAFVDEVRCRPAEPGAPAPAPRLQRWTSPVDDGHDSRVQPEQGVVRLSESWQIAVTRAGLWLTETDEQRPPLADRLADPDGPAIEVGRAGQALDESLTPVLGTLLGGLAAEVRGKARLFVHGASTDDGRALRRTAAEHALRAIRFETTPAAPQEAGYGTTTLPRNPLRYAAEGPPTPARRARPAPEAAAAPAAGDFPAPAAAPVPEAAPVPDSASPPTGSEPAPTSSGEAASSPDPHQVESDEREPWEPPPPFPPSPSPDIRTTSAPAERASARRLPARDEAGEETSEPRTPEPPPVAAPETRPAGPSHRRPAVVSVSAGPLPAVPFLPGHASTAAQRAAFRRLAEESWERHGAAVTRALTRMPALRGPELEDARDDLIALHAYLHAAEGPLGHDELARGVRAGDERALCYAACVASALRRLPSYRGPAFRGTDGADDGVVPGNLVRDAAPVGGLPHWPGTPRPAGPQYVIWSATGRRVRELTGGPGAAAKRDEIVFAPGTLLRVLDVRESDGDGARLVLMREVSSAPAATNAGTIPQSTELDEYDRATLDRLDEALRSHPRAPGPFNWPETCAGPLGR